MSLYTADTAYIAHTADTPDTMVRSAEKLPLYEAAMWAVETPGTLLKIAAPGDIQELPVPIPRLAGLDEIEIERVGFDLSTAEQEEEFSVAGKPANGAVTLSFQGAAGGAGVAGAARLKRIDIEDLSIVSTATDSFYVAGGGGNLARVVYGWDAGKSAAVTVPDGDPGEANAIHVLLRPSSGSGFGPPSHAAPAFALQGAGAGMYGPALGGASLTLVKRDSGQVDATLTLSQPLGATRVQMLLGHAGQKSADAGLPTDVVPVTWSAANVKATFDARPSAIEVRGAVGTGGETPLVAQFPGDPGGSPVAVDFAPVARSLLKKAYPTSQGTDLGLKLLFTAAAPGTLRVNLGTAKARYLSRPLAHGPAEVALRGAPETVGLLITPGLKPAAVSLTIDGTFGPGRLTLDSDTEVPDARHGLRVAGPVRVARQLALTAAEAGMPLLRLGLWGRASEKTEALLTLHKGDRIRIGAAVAPPVSLEILPADRAGWHRVEFAAPGLLPPHPQALWLIVRTTHGAFWWHGAPEPTGFTQRSPDDGATFSSVPGRPIVHVSVKEIDTPGGTPWPLSPVALGWRDGGLNADLAEIANRPVASGAQFRRFWIAQRGPAAFLDSIAGLGGVFELTFGCRRDLDLSVSDAVLTYDPWNA